ncbi:MAG: hypothetical protein PHG97_00595 [Candidatus Margulisbacteria bacterium]|nr:hypothetical protein [Candidatus Margulisiibacteriota bacterium]
MTGKIGSLTRFVKKWAWPITFAVGAAYGGYVYFAPSSDKKPPKELCAEKNLAPRDFHLCIIDENLKIHEAFRQKSVRENIVKTNADLGLVETPSPEAGNGPAATARHGLITASRHANSQTDNWLLLEAARKGIYLFYLTEEGAYLKQAETLLNAALANKDISVGFDTNPGAFKNLGSETIFPVEGYFELKLTRLQILNILDPGAAVLLSREIEKELADPRMVDAQRSNSISAQGYVNRLRLLKSDLAYFQPNADLDAGIRAADESRLWAESEGNRPVQYLLAYGLNRKDLRHDALQSEIFAARLLALKELKKPAEARDFSPAVKKFRAVLDSPEATQKNGGFLDLGLDAFVNLLHIAIVASHSRAEAAANFDKFVDWNKVNALPDFKESLGLLVREESFCSKLSNRTSETCPEPKEVISNVFLYFGWSGLALKDTKPVITEINLLEPAISDPETRMDIILKCLESSDVKKKLLVAIKTWWSTWENK